jgi:uncharacterized membrane protein YkvA (DUF1232 family)
MPWWASVGVSVALTLVLGWLAVAFVLVRAGRGLAGLTEAAQVLPDVLRLVSRLARDRSLPRAVRLRLWLLLGYLLSPIDLVPDVVPVAGYVDDAIVVALVLRGVVRRVGSDPLERHWPGSPQGLTAVRRLAGLGTAQAARYGEPMRKEPRAGRARSRPM